MTETPYDPAGTPPPPSSGNTNRTGSASYQLARFFDWIRASGLTRGSDRWIAGVCGSIAARTGLDPLIVRGIAIVIAILGGPLVFAYAIGWALIPNSEGRIYLEEAFRKRFEPAMIAIGALLFFTIVPAFRGFWWNGMPGAWGLPDWLATTFSVGWALLLTAGVIWLVVVLLRHLPASTFRPGPTPPASGYGSAPQPPATPGAPSGPSAADAPARPTASSFAPADAAPTSSAGTGTTSSGYGGSSSVGSAYAAPGATATPPITDRSSWDALTEKHSAQREARRLKEAARYRRRNPGAGFTAIVLGIALLAAATTAVVFSGGTWSPDALVIGLAVGLGVLALGIIVSGIRGRVSGAMGGFAFLAAVALLVVGVIPAGTQFSAFGGSGWRAEATGSSTDFGNETVPGYAMIAGEATVDLRALADTRNADDVAGRVIDVWVGLGVTQLELPSNTAIRVETNTFIGAVDYAAGANFGSGSADADTVDRGGVFLHDSRTFSADDAEYDVPIPVIRVWSLIGQVDVIEAR
ncbi:PspC domain-containing protein [Cryobacterium melibiosiphilum]|uniref:PspC domain-containing protein n=1 Tax=Cryobacterium melibiosiphilum TaxID=995039 RepID=A0A3A5MAT5_9MICO|nr:PspC domain-containing protein [Cryobacterium melibiosiphilum]RJT85198.1 PspC domain-containing protein [Cryobacterium melibiosiphilum]